MKRYIKSSTNLTHNNMTIVVKSGINADGFKVLITDDDDQLVYEQEYSFGYNVSYDRRWADESKPYVNDIINDLCIEYNIDKQNIQYQKGINVFKGNEVSDDVIDKFKLYLQQ